MTTNNEMKHTEIITDIPTEEEVEAFMAKLNEFSVPADRYLEKTSTEDSK